MLAPVRFFSIVLGAGYSRSGRHMPASEATLRLQSSHHFTAFITLHFAPGPSLSHSNQASCLQSLIGVAAGRFSKEPWANAMKISDCGRDVLSVG